MSGNEIAALLAIAWAFVVGVWLGWCTDLSSEFIRGAQLACETHGGVIAMDQSGADCGDGSRFKAKTLRQLGGA